MMSVQSFEMSSPGIFSPLSRMRWAAIHLGCLVKAGAGRSAGIGTGGAGMTPRPLGGWAGKGLCNAGFSDVVELDNIGAVSHAGTGKDGGFARGAGGNVKLS